MNELMKSNPSNSISLSIYFFYAFASFHKQITLKPLLKIILIVERHRYRISPCGDDKSILTFVLQQNGAVAGDWRLDIETLQQFVFF